MKLLFEGQLSQSPFKGEYFLSDIRPRTLETEADFVSYRALARPTWAPVLMSFPQKGRFLSSILTCMLNTVWDDVDRLLMVCRVPGIRMPLELGQDKILQVVELAPEVERLSALGESFLAMDEGFVRHPLETGNNELRLQWHGARAHDAAEKFAALCNALRSLGLHEPGQAT